MLYTVIILLGVVLDQTVKYLVRARIALGTAVPFLPGIMDLTYVRNTGAAFSILREHTWILTIISLAAAVLLAVLMVRTFRSPGGRIPLALVLSGAVGNLIDRMLFGFVTDMFATTFMSFPVFNVADIFITVGGAAFCVYYLFFCGRPEGKENDHDAASSDR